MDCQVKHNNSDTISVSAFLLLCHRMPKTIRLLWAHSAGGVGPCTAGFVAFGPVVKENVMTGRRGGVNLSQTQKERVGFCCPDRNRSPVPKEYHFEIVHLPILPVWEPRL